MPQSLHFRFVLLSLAVMILALPSVSVEAATSANKCKHLSPQKMAVCQQKAKTDMNKPGKGQMQKPKSGIDAKDLLWLLL